MWVSIYSKAGSNLLECQTCGEVLKELSPAQRQQVAADPYKYIVFCKICAKDEVND